MLQLTKDFKKIALDMLSEFGFSITINSFLYEEFNLETGQKDKTYISFNEKAIFLSFQSGEFLESTYTVQSGDKKILCTAENTLISIDNIIIIDSISYVIKNMQEIKLGLDNIIYKMIIREKK